MQPTVYASRNVRLIRIVQAAAPVELATSLPGSTVLLSAVVAGQEEVSPSIREVRPGTLWMAQPGALRAEQVGIRWTAQRMSQEAKMGAGTGCARARKQAKAARRTAN